MVMNFKSTPFLVLFIILGAVGITAAYGAVTLVGDLIVQGTVTADNYFDNGNTQTGPDATALGGVGNVASGQETTIGGGSNNRAVALGSTVGGGRNNEARASSSTVGGGSTNTHVMVATCLPVKLDCSVII